MPTVVTKLNLEQPTPEIGSRSNSRVSFGKTENHGIANHGFAARSNSRLGELASQPESEPSRALSRSFSRSSNCQSRASRMSSKVANTRIAVLTEHPWFQNTTLFVICINAMWIGADVEWNNAALKTDAEDKLPWEPVSTIVENCFCVYFTVEVVLRFFAFRFKKDCLRDAWFVFDAFLVAFMVLETWILPIITLAMGGGGDSGSLSSLSALRITRLSRMVRLSRSVPELRTLVKSMISGLKATLTILIFLVMILWLFAIIFTTQLACVPPFDGAEEGDETCPPNFDLDDGAGNRGHLFGSVGSSMMTLFTNGVLGDNLYQTLDIIKGEGKLSDLIMWWLFSGFFTLTALTLLNMLIGVLIDNIAQTAKGEESSMWEEEFKLCMENAFDKIDKDHSGTVTVQEWLHIREDEEVRRTLANDFQCDEDFLDGQMDKMEAVLFCSESGSGAKKSIFDPGPAISMEDSDGIGFEEFVASMLELRPDKEATPLDLALLERYLDHNYSHLLKSLSKIQGAVGGDCPIQVTPQQRSPRSSAGSMKSTPSLKGALRELSPTRSNISEVVLPADLPEIRHPGLRWTAGLPTPSSSPWNQVAEVDAASIPAWLQEVPTEVLFSILQYRARQPGTVQSFNEDARIAEVVQPVLDPG